MHGFEPEEDTLILLALERTGELSQSADGLGLGAAAGLQAGGGVPIPCTILASWLDAWLLQAHEKHSTQRLAMARVGVRALISSPECQDGRHGSSAVL